MKIGVGATKALSLLVVWCMVCSAFAGMLVLMVPEAGQALSPSEVDGDVYIGQDFTNNTWEVGGTVNLNGDLVIRAGGVVNVTNGLLKFRSYDGHINQLIIEDGGRLNLVNSAIEAEYALYNVSYSLGVLVRNGGVLYAEASLLDFRGKVLVDDAALIAHETTISGPLFTAMSSQIELYDSELIDTPGFPMEEELTYSYPFASALNQSVGVTYLFERNPSGSSTHDVALVQMNDLFNVTLAQNEELETTGFDIGGLVFDADEAVSMTLKAEYKTADDYVAGGDNFEYSLYMGAPVATGMVIVETYEAYNPAATNKEMVLSEDITGLELSSVDLSMLSVNLLNTRPQSVMIDRIWVEVELAIPAYHNITIAGMSELTAVNSVIGANYLGYSDYNFRKLVVSDAAQANLYGVEVEGTFFPEGMGPFVTVSKTIAFKPLLQGIEDTSVETSIYDLVFDDNSQYVALGDGVLHAQSFNSGGIVGLINSIEIEVEYTANAGYASSQPVTWNVTGMPLTNTAMVIDSLTTETLTYAIPDGIITKTDQLSGVNIVFVNNDPEPVSFDRIWMNGVFDPSINIYRWADVKVVDSNNLPVAGAQVNATLSPSGVPAYYLYNDSVNSVPPQGVLDYLGRNATSISSTNDSGMVLLPLLTDIINPEQAPNSYAIENYKISVDYVNTTGHHFTPAPGNSTFEGYPQLGVQIISIEFVLDDLMLELPDVKAINLTTDPTTVYQGDTVTLNFQVTNVGLTTASEFAVTIVDSIGNVTNNLGTINVTNLLFGETRNLSMVWMSNYTTPGTHSIVITVDPEDEVVESDENNVLTVPVTVLAFLPDLAVTGVQFSQNPGFAKQPMYINANISNVAGKLVAINASVSFYIGNPMSGGVLQGRTLVEVAAGGTAVVNFTWTPLQIGTYPIYVTVNEAVGGVRPIAEYRYDNNTASAVLAVILVADTNDWLVTDVAPAIDGAVLSWQNNIIVEDDGHLSLVNTQLFMNQVSTNKPIQIVVRGNGVLELDHTTIGSNYALRIYLFDNGRLYLNSSTLSTNVVLVLDDTSMAYMEESRVMDDLQAPASSSAELVAFNSTFGKAWTYFGGSSTAELTGTSINGAPAVSPKDSATVTLYSWIVASVYDGTKLHKIPGAYVEARSFIDQNVYATGLTNEDGEWMFRALSDVITAAGPGSVVSGNYQLNATHWYAGDRYDSDADKIAQVQYNPDVVLVRSDAQVRLNISSALPDVDPPFNASASSVFRGDEVILSTVINNVGVVTAYDILVRFEDNSSMGKVIIEDYLIEELAAESNITVTVIWVADYPIEENHTLSVTVDPLDQIPELNEDNNFNSTTVFVMGVPDLVITASDISVDPSSPVRDLPASIYATVRNIGDGAISTIFITFYDDGVELGVRNLSNLAQGQSALVSMGWVPASPGTHVIKVCVDEDDLINEADEINNNASQSVSVRDYPDLSASIIRFSAGSQAVAEVSVNTDVTITVDVSNDGESTAGVFSVAFWLDYGTVGAELIGIVTSTGDLSVGSKVSVSTHWIASIVEGEGLIQNRTITALVNPAEAANHYPEIYDTNNQAQDQISVVDDRPDMAVQNGRVQYGGQNITSATVGQRVNVLFDVRNIGIIDGTGITVSLSLVNESHDMLLFTQTVNVEAGESVSYNQSYLVNVTSDDYTFVIDVDAGADSDQSDNVLELDFTVTVPDPVITITSPSSNAGFAPGTSIFVQGTVKQSGSNAPLAGQILRIRVVDSQGYSPSNGITATTNANGQFSQSVPVPSGKEGAHRVEVTLISSEGEFPPTYQEIDIVAPFAPETIPSWVYLLIVAIVIAVIVIFSLYLYRVGLGRMVECGNCGALIPEASRHCPKCGVEFESDTAKCSECGAWIPSKAESCPDCGAKFMTEPMETGQAPGYIEAMRKQYDEYIEAFRVQAKAALGSKYSEEKFMEWLQTEPNYLPFEEWLRKEEMSRRSGVFPCPACGTLNPRDSKICNRCGTVFDQQGRSEAPKAEEKKSPFRRIVRRSGESNEAPKEQTPAEPKPDESGDKPQ